MDILIEPACADPTDAVARDHALMTRMADAPDPAPLLRLWVNARAVVVGRKLTRLPNYDHACTTGADAGWPVVERDSGGTAVAHYAGVVNITLIRAESGTARSLEAGYTALCAPIIAALARQGISATTGSVPGAYCDGDYNIVSGGRKLAGTAQRWKKHRAGTGQILLAHASLNIADSATGVNAVNRFYAQAGGADVFNAGAHTDCVAENPDFDPETLIRRDLPEAFSRPPA